MPLLQSVWLLLLSIYLRLSHPQHHKNERPLTRPLLLKEDYLFTSLWLAIFPADDQCVCWLLRAFLVELILCEEIVSVGMKRAVWSFT